MKRIVNLFAAFCAVSLAASVSAMNVPGPGVRVFPYGPTVTPSTGPNPAAVNPLGVGPVAAGGTEVSIELALDAFREAVDVYVGILAPELSPELLLVGPGPSLHPVSSGLVAWRSGVTGPVRDTIFPGISTDILPAGTYTLFAAAAAAGSFDAMYLWQTDFIVDGPCRFVRAETLDQLRAAGTDGSLVQNGSVKVGGTRPLSTDYAAEVGLWIDDSLLNLTTDAAALALRYFEHANCIYGAGSNGETGEGVNAMSFRLFNDEIRYFDITTPPVDGNSVWIQQVHWDWRQAIETLAQSQPVAKINLLVTARNFVETDGSGWGGVGGASNGVGQGQAIVVVSPDYFENGMVVNSIARNHAEDWWGVIVAHELGHAMGRGGHIDQLFNVMCCVPGNDYPGAGRGTVPSHDFALSDWSWQAIWQNHLDTSDGYSDPYASAPNPVTSSLWDFDQISGFLGEAKPGDVLVAPSTGSSFASADLRHDWFCINDEVCLTGDFNGDGLHDLVAFTRGTTGDVYVALATPVDFSGTGVKWHDFFSINQEIPLVGDFNGDGRDDIATFTRGTTGDVYVALSTGTSFSGKGVKWHDFFSINQEIPLVGDFNGDGRDDIASFTRGTTGDVYVALSTGNSFTGRGVKWHDFFSINEEIPRVGDFNGDGRDDIASFTRGPSGDVYVALSTGSSFSGTGVKWHDFFSINQEIPFTGDINGDGRDDIVTFMRGSRGKVFAALSTGTSFSGKGVVWADGFCLDQDVCQVADVTGNGRADAIAFKRNND